MQRKIQMPVIETLVSVLWDRQSKQLLSLRSGVLLGYLLITNKECQSWNLSSPGPKKKLHLTFSMKSMPVSLLLFLLSFLLRLLAFSISRGSFLCSLLLLLQLFRCHLGIAIYKIVLLPVLVLMCFLCALNRPQWQKYSEQEAYGKNIWMDGVQSKVF